jgi:hypothetical protein
MPRNFALSILRLGVHPLLSLLNTGHRIRFRLLLAKPNPALARGVPVSADQPNLA